jgi:flagellar FliJ protein
MANLNPLIRLRRFLVEDKQKVLSALYREAENLQNKRQALQDQMAHEKELAIQQNSPDASADYSRYAENVRKKITQFNEAIKKIEARIDVAQEEVRAAFADMKKVQIVQRTREEAEQKEEDAKEAAALDEIGLDGFRRKDDT